MWWYEMSWYIGNSLLSPPRYLSIWSWNSLACATVIDCLVAIFVAMIRSQKFRNRRFSWLSQGKEPHRWPSVTMRCTVQKTCHSSAETFPWPLSLMCGEAGVHQDGKVIFSMSAQISWSLVWPRTQVLPWFELICFARARCSGSGLQSLSTLSVIPSWCL